MIKTVKNFINKIIYQQRINHHGKNNEFICPNSARLKRIKIDFWGNNNKIIIGENTYLNNTKIIIGFPNCPVENCTIQIGNKTSFNSLYLQMGEDNSSVIIGENCRCSYNIELNCTDHHSIFDKEGNILNIGKKISIGNHVWICKDVRILKNSNIPDGCVIAQGSIVTKNFDKENCVIAGNPAKVVKENIRISFSK